MQRGGRGWSGVQTAGTLTSEGNLTLARFWERHLNRLCRMHELREKAPLSVEVPPLLLLFF